jgi:hypothetical protein
VPATASLGRSWRGLTKKALIGWSRDVTIDIADELRRRYVEVEEVPEAVLAFMDANQRR